MPEQSIKFNNVTKLQITISLILFLFITIAGATYAYFAISASDTGTITGNAATVNLTLDVEKIFPAPEKPNTGAIVPQLSTSESEQSPLSTALKSGCVDGNTNIVCQVYKITIQNSGGTATQVVDGSITFYGNSAMTSDINTTMPNLKWKLITSANKTTPNSSILGTEKDKSASSNNNLEENIFANDITLSTNVSKEYYIIIWINETAKDQPTDVGKSFFGKIEFNSSNGTGVTSTFS